MGLAVGEAGSRGGGEVAVGFLAGLEGLAKGQKGLLKTDEGIVFQVPDRVRTRERLQTRAREAEEPPGQGEAND